MRGLSFAVRARAVAFAQSLSFNRLMGRVVRIDWQRHKKRRRRATVRQITMFVIVFILTVVGGLIWTSGFRPLAWFDRQRSQPLTDNVRVVDGDTLRVDGERIRIASIDTPEMPPNSRCAAEAVLAERAKANLERMVGTGRQFAFVPNFGRERDVYGRLLGSVLIDGEEVGHAQLKAGLAQRWMGRHAVWC